MRFIEIVTPYLIHFMIFSLDVDLVIGFVRYTVDKFSKYYS
jgi:hypothetical protein